MPLKQPTQVKEQDPVRPAELQLPIKSRQIAPSPAFEDIAHRDRGIDADRIGGPGRDDSHVTAGPDKTHWPIQPHARPQEPQPAATPQTQSSPACCPGLQIPPTPIGRSLQQANRAARAVQQSHYKLKKPRPEGRG